MVLVFCVNSIIFKLFVFGVCEWRMQSFVWVKASSATHYDDLQRMDGILQVRAAFSAGRAEVGVVAVDVLDTKRLGTDAAARDVTAAASGAQAAGRGWRRLGHQ
jgi:hypothetical protein